MGKKNEGLITKMTEYSEQCKIMVHECRGQLALYTAARYGFLQGRNDYITLMEECTTEDAVALIRSQIPIPEDMTVEIRSVMGKLTSEDDLCLQVTRLCQILGQANKDLKEVTGDLKKKTLKYREQCVLNSVGEFDGLIAALNGRPVSPPKEIGGTVLAIRIRAAGGGRKKKKKKKKKKKRKSRSHQKKK